MNARYYYKEENGKFYIYDNKSTTPNLAIAVEQTEDIATAQCFKFNFIDTVDELAYKDDTDALYSLVRAYGDNPISGYARQAIGYLERDRYEFH